MIVDLEPCRADSCAFAPQDHRGSGIRSRCPEPHAAAAALCRTWLRRPGKGSQRAQTAHKRLINGSNGSNGSRIEAPWLMASGASAVETDPLRGLFEATIDGRWRVVEYEPDAELRDTEQVPLLEEGGVEGGDPRVAGHVRLLEEMAADAGIDELASAYELHCQLDELLAGKKTEMDFRGIEGCVEACRVIAARLARSENQEERRNLRRLREALERDFAESVLIFFDQQNFTAAEFAGYLEEIPDFARAFLRPFCRFFEPAPAQTES